MKKTLLLLYLAVSGLYGSSLAQVQPGGRKNYDILHVNGKKAPPAGVKNKIAEAVGQNPLTKAFPGQQYYLLQFFDIPPESKKNEYRQYGIELLDYFPNYAYYAWFSKDVNPQRLNQLQVRAVLDIDSTLKLAPELLSGSYPAYAYNNGILQLDVTAFANADLNALVSRLAQYGASVKPLEPGSRIIHITIPVSLLGTLTAEKQVQFIAPTPPPPEPEYDQNNFGRSNVINSGYNGITYNGKGITTMVREGDGVNDNIDYAGRLTVKTSEPGGPGSHATGCAFRLGSAGNIDPSTRSNAWGANILSMGGGNLFDLYDNATKLRIVNMSYGWGTTGGYNGESNEHDRLIRTRPEAMLVYSSGNSGGDTTRGGMYNGIPGWGNLTGQPKHAKNLLVVSGTNYEDVFYDWTCKGPAYDGRVKPELSIEGSEGTSFAAPKVAGIMAILYDAYKTETNSNTLKSGLLKAVLMNTADDIYNPGIDFKTGYGRPNVRRAYQVIRKQQFITDSMAQQGSKNFTVTVPTGTKQLRVMLYWTDYEASPGAARALVNDLDLTVSSPGGTATLPWVLDTTPDPAKLNLPPTRKEDHLNNTEQVTIDDPNTGDYTINISGYQVPQGTQEFYIVYEFVKDEVVMTFPIGGESLKPGGQEYVRWDAFGTSGTFDLEYSANNGSSWTSITTGIPAASRAYKWSMPAAYGKYLVRIKRGSQADTSKPFSIFPIPANLKTDWVCADQMQVRWNKTAQTKEYEVFRLGEKYMEPIGRTTDTVMTIATDSSKEEWLAVRAIGLNGEEGLRTIAFKKEKGAYRCNNFYTGIAQHIRKDTSLLTGIINPHGQTIDNIFFEYGPTTTYGSQVAIPGTFTGINDIAVQQYAAITLTGDSTWHYRLKGKVNGQDIYGDDRQLQPAPGFAMQFTGNESLVVGNNNAFIGAKPRTIALWARADAFNNGGLFFTGATGTTYGEFSLRTLTSDNSWRVQLWNNNKDFTLPDSKGEWHHFALVYNGTQLSFYYDGALQSTWAVTLDTKASAINFGTWNGTKLQGQLDEISVWNTALTADQVRKMMHHPLAGNETGLLYYTNFDDFGPQVYEAVSRQELTISNGPAKIPATIPVGPGATATFTEPAAGFTSGGAAFAYNQQNAAALAISSMALNNYNKGGLPTVYTPLANGYWIGHRYGTGNLDMNVTLKADHSLQGLNPAKIVLMGKQPYAAGKWGFVALASSVDTTQQTITFNNQKAYTQLLPVYIDSAFAAGSADTLTLTDARTGAVTAPVSFSLSGVNITDTLVVRAPDGFLVSRYSDSAYSKQFSIAPVNGAVKDVKVYARFAPVSAGIFSGNITVTTGAKTLAGTYVRQQAVTPETTAGKSMSFDGNGDYLDIDNLNWQPKEFTIEWWHKAKSAKNYNQSIGNGWGSFLVHADNTAGLNIGVANNTSSRLLVANAFSDLNTWHHYAYTFKNGEAKIYRDGVLKDSKPSSAYPPMWNTFRIGASDGNSIDGEMEEFRMWSVARTQQEIRENMHLTLKGSEPGLKVYLQFQDAENGVVDVSDNAYRIRRSGDAVRVTSAVPVAQGVSQTKTITADGYTLFGQTGIGLAFGNGSNPSGEVVISRLQAKPDVSITPAPIGNAYWVIRNYGANATFTGLTQVLLDSLTQTGTDTTTSAIYSAYSRKFNDVGNTWAPKARSTNISNNQLVFTIDSTNNWNSFGQLAINRLAVTSPDTLAGQAFQFNGNNGYLDITGLNWKPTSFTIEWWLRTRSSKDWNQSFGNGWGSFLAHGNNNGSMSIGVANNSNSRMEVPGAYSDPDTWHHYAYTFDNGQAKIYRDGVLADSKTASSFPPLWNSFRIGDDNGNTLDGDLDEFRMWSVARTEQDIRENMHLTLKGNEAGLKVYLQFQGAQPGYVTDVTANHYVAAINGNVTTVASTVPVGAGSSQTLTATAATTLDYAQLGLRAAVDSAATIMVSKLNTLPDHSINTAPLWILHQFSGDRKLTGLRNIIVRRQQDPSRNFVLHRRAFNTYGNTWDTVTVNGWQDSANVSFRIDTGLSGARQLAITTATNQQPFVQIIQPATNESFGRTAITVSATAFDADGTVRKVEFFAGNMKIGETAAQPYTITWGPVSTGSYAITARATDNAGAVSISTPVTIWVNNPHDCTDPDWSAAKAYIKGDRVTCNGFVYVALQNVTGTTPQRNGQGPWSKVGPCGRGNAPADTSATSAHTALTAAMKSVSAFPNPTLGSFYVTLPQVAYRSGTLKVLDSKGIPVYVQALQGNTSTQQRVDISAQPQGIYFIQLIIDGQVVTLKIIRL
ncbi:MAG TPA: LamG-like jellyroll fold domain-containing protein [Chitinophaga sp.]|uniref:LamG-like jellyroll fold domain-containing protein n=1 Tax=Chitinophaga sp. TaxID=1869181 RepID=UPI002BA5E23A|nr:LamG-like jellyroll fold domain-containing protein [Chitinophaga sp.]HVI49242.1 LamG-like jellyroll fold domain-containing protein [Chitinophaga sp.]